MLLVFIPKKVTKLVKNIKLLPTGKEVPGERKSPQPHPSPGPPSLPTKGQRLASV